MTVSMQENDAIEELREAFIVFVDRDQDGYISANDVSPFSVNLDLIQQSYP